MVIHNDYPELKVELVVKGKSLPEYGGDDTIPELNTVTKYVEAQVGTQFGIRCSYGSSFPNDKDISVKISADGNVLHRCISRKTDIHPSKTLIFDCTQRVIGGEWVERRFRFSNLIASKCTICSSMTINLSDRSHSREGVWDLD